MKCHEHSLINKIKSAVSIKPEEEEFISSFFKEKKYKRGDSLLRTGDVPHEIFFILEGGLHQFYLDEQGNESTSFQKYPPHKILALFFSGKTIHGPFGKHTGNISAGTSKYMAQYPGIAPEKFNPV